ncbi:MAG: hypothetical protein GY743_23285 [Planctomycetaceae bacterium]|nr:hypothetical protein [Planctomycetaceae bacterium]
MPTFNPHTPTKSTFHSIWLPPDGNFTAAKVFQLGQVGANGKTIPRGSRTAVFGRDAFGRSRIVSSLNENPGGLPGITIERYQGLGIDVIEDIATRQACRYLQERITNGCIGLDSPASWCKLYHYARALAGDGSPGDGPNLDGSETNPTLSDPFLAENVVILVNQSLSRITTSEADDLTDIIFLDDPESCTECASGYPGPDVIGYISTRSASGTGDVLYTSDGGATWAATSADPWAATETGDHLVWNWISKTQFRLGIALASADAAAKPAISYADVDVATPVTTTWTEVSLTDGANNEIVDFMLWPRMSGFIDRWYVSRSAGDIDVSADQGATWTNIFAGSNQLDYMATDPRGNVYAVGAANTILKETAQSNTFAALVGPSGGGAFTSIAIAQDGTIWAGNGTSLFRNSNDGFSAGGWTEVKDFGANHAVIGIDIIDNDSQLIRLVVEDGTGTDGDVWRSEDGGGFIREITDLSNSGYNGFYFSGDNVNLAWIVGETDSATGLIHKLSESATC